MNKTNKIIKSFKTKLFEDIDIDQQRMQQIESYMDKDTRKVLENSIKNILDSFSIEDDYGTEIKNVETVLFDIAEAQSGESILCALAFIFRIKLDKNGKCSIELEFDNPTNGQSLGVARKWEGIDGFHKFDSEFKDLRDNVLLKYNEAVYYFWNGLDV